MPPHRYPSRRKRRAVVMSCAALAGGVLRLTSAALRYRWSPSYFSEYFDPARLGVGEGESGAEGQLDQASRGASGGGGLGGVVRPRSDATFGVVTWAGCTAGDSSRAAGRRGWRLCGQLLVGDPPGVAP